MKKIFELIKIKSNTNKDILKTLKSIDARMAHLEECIAINHKGYGKNKYIITGNWND